MWQSVVNVVWPTFVCLLILASCATQIVTCFRRDTVRGGGREGGREGERDEGREGGREKERYCEGGREGGREEGRKGGREREREIL